MLTHAFTLRALASEFHAALAGLSVVACFSQRRNELRLDCGGPTLCVSVEPGAAYAVLREEASRARRNSVDLFHSIPGRGILGVRAHPADRALLVDFDGGYMLALLLYNTAAGNVYLLDPEGTVMVAFKRGKELAGTQSPIQPRADQVPECPEDEEDLKSLLVAAGEEKLLVALRRAVPILGSLYAREVLARAALASEVFVADLAAGDLTRLHLCLCGLLGEANHPSPRLVKTGSGDLICSVVPLRQPGCEELGRQFTSVNEAVRACFLERTRSENLSGEKESLQENLREELRRLRRSVEKAADATSDQAADRHTRTGSLLLAHLGELRKGMTRAVLAPPGEEQSIEVALDPALTPVENAERYFQKAKNARVAASVSARRLRSQRNVLERLSQAEAELERCESPEDLLRFFSSFGAVLRPFGLVRARAGPRADEDKEGLPFRRFRVAGDLELWVGKNNSSNDLLTLNYARPGDLWFHARGVSGSHALLRVHGRRDPVPREAILQAAATAAYYSKMRKAGTVPVAWCERKYVRKPKGSPPGTVVLEREEVVFVRPQLP